MSETKKGIDSGERSGLSEDWTSVVVGVSVVVLALMVSLLSIPEGLTWNSPWPEGDAKPAFEWNSQAKSYLGLVGKWEQNPLAGLWSSNLEMGAEATDSEKIKYYWPGILGSAVFLAVIGLAASALRNRSIVTFVPAFLFVFLLATISYVLANQVYVKHLNLEYALWALLIGMVISNTVGVSGWLKPAVMGEQYIKIGLVLLGSEVLLGKLLALGIPGIAVAWIVTPIVLISTYIFGQRVLKMESRSLNMVISADMSVCGVSAAIATAAACKAKKEELSLAVGLSLSFTVVMMIAMPYAINAMGLDPVVGGAWMGGTIDATGAVAAAGEMLARGDSEAGKAARDAAVTIKMIQNILIGVTAFFVALYWTTVVERKSAKESNVGLGEIWKRFPKFVLGFILLSILISILSASSLWANLWVNSAIKGVVADTRKWLFCLAFVSIGLDTNFRQLLPYFRSGKPAVLYVVGQSLNLLLTLAMAYLMFGILFKQGG